MKKYNIFIMGGSGVVGKEIIEVLFDKKFPIKNLELYSSIKSSGKKIITKFGEIILKNSNDVNYKNCDIAFFCINGKWSFENAKKATSENCIVIDNSSHFRYDKDVPLIIPQINSDKIKNNLLISNPNCTTAIASIPLWILHKNFKIKKIIISTYQAVSGAGNSGINELLENTKKELNKEKQKNETFCHDIAFNLIPHIDKFQENLYTKEEMKVVWELQKIFNDESIKISCTCVRIPTLRSHSESIVVECENEIDLNLFKDLLKKNEGVKLVDDIKNNIYPMPKTATKFYDVEVGRIRHNLIYGKNSVEFFVCGDQLLRGAALNSVEIAKKVISK